MDFAGARSRGKRREDSKEVRISKSLSWLLRHGASQEGFQLDEGGFLDVDAVLRHPRFRDVTVAILESVVANNDKRRFSLRRHPSTGRLQIKANQGHSLGVESLDLKPITVDEAGKFENVIHGTNLKAWNQIRDSGFLSRMGRTHVHFAPGEFGDDVVVSGMRKSSDVWIYVDLVRALRDGFSFFLSPNNVILCPGDANGNLPMDYFAKVVQRRKDGNHRVIHPSSG